MAESADATDLKSVGLNNRASSSLATATSSRNNSEVKGENPVEEKCCRHGHHRNKEWRS